LSHLGSPPAGQPQPEILSVEKNADHQAITSTNNPAGKVTHLYAFLQPAK
jgi:hypothetical protein